jgi:hypothetical protein
MVDVNGIHLPRKIPYGAIGVAIAFAVQFVGVVVWASNEHAERVNLRARFDEYVAASDRWRSTILTEATARNRTQDETTHRLDQTLLTTVRRLDIVEERQTQGARAIAAFSELQVKLEGRLTGIESAIHRLDEQQTRILRALDSTYNTLQEHLRVDHSGNTGIQKNQDIWKEQRK